MGVTDVKMSVTGTHPPRDYCVQYRESDLDFISRLLEEEGIFYFFEHTKDKHTMVFADAPAAIKAGPVSKLEHEPGVDRAPRRRTSSRRWISGARCAAAR